MTDWKITNRSTQPIGLDIGHSAIKMIQLAEGGERAGILAAKKVAIAPELSDNPEERRRFIILSIKQMLAEASFVGRNVVSGLPNEKLRITSVRVSDSDTDRTEQILTTEAAHRFGLDPDKDAIRHINAGNVRQGDDVKSEYILFGVDDDTIKGHIAMLEDAELKPVGLDAIPCALFRNFDRLMRRQEDRERTVIFVDVGSHFTTVLFGRAQEMCFVKQIPVGAERFTREVADKLAISAAEAELLRMNLQHQTLQAGAGDASASAPGNSSSDHNGLDAPTRQGIAATIRSVAEQLTREISLCLRYYSVTFRGKRIEKAIIAGGGAYETIFVDTVRQRLGLETETAEPLRGVSLRGLALDPDRRGLLCEWAVAVGLSLKGVQYRSHGVRRPRARRAMVPREVARR